MEKQSRRYPIWLWIILFIVGIVAIGLLVITYRHEAWDFRNNLWGPARLLLQGQKPWDLAALSALSETWGLPFYRSIWFPTSIGVGLPLGLLPLPNATNVWLLLSVAATILSVVLVYGARDLRQTPPALLATGLAVTIFLPLYAHLLLGQVSLLVLASLVAGWMLLEHDRPGWAGIVLSFAWAKPQLVLLIWPALAWLAWKRGQFRPVFLGWLAGSLLQTLPLWILDPTWPAGYVEALRTNQDWRQPNLHSLVVNFSGSIVLAWVLLLVALGLAAVWLARFWKRTSSVVALAWTLGLTPFLSPYSWSWDQVLLLPLLPVILRTGRRGIHRVIWWIVYLICMMVYAALRLPTSSDVWFAWFPLVFLLISAYLSPPTATNEIPEGHQSLES
jgi:hypothetical protein